MASDQGEHCLHLIKEFLNSIVIRINKTTQTLLPLEVDLSKKLKIPLGMNGLKQDYPFFVALFILSQY